jgi:hypothetical protein
MLRYRHRAIHTGCGMGCKRWLEPSVAVPAGGCSLSAASSSSPSCR